VAFTYDDLRAPADEGEKEVFKKFQGLTCKGQLIFTWRHRSTMKRFSELAHSPRSSPSSSGPQPRAGRPASVPFS
jgi:hypothetical protein